ncbi:MAG: class I SAM-dependent methyltransferase [Spirochaetales bacterium]|nr:class I SAM-dependent methyltransferase [Spirochaetales bacterium]
MKDSKTRFSDRVENYIKYRPHYPREIISVLKQKINLDKKWIIADIGSGTGISSELFIENGNIVYGIEPNDEMRSAAEKYFTGNNNFISIPGSAETTTLKENSMDLVITGQAFHWFDIKKTRDEFIRILKNNCYTVLFWNERKTEGSGFQIDYEIFLRKYCKEYNMVTQKNITSEQFVRFYGSGDYKYEKMNNSQKFNFEGLKGRLQSSSYSPNPDDPVYYEMTEKLFCLFQKHERDGQVSFEYDTEVYYGKIV